MRENEAIHYKDGQTAVDINRDIETVGLMSGKNVSWSENWLRFEEYILQQTLVLLIN